MPDLDPPWKLSLPARRTWDRLAAEIHRQGRWTSIAHDLLAVYCQTLELYFDATRDVIENGILVRGRTAKERVRNPALTPQSQLRADLIRLAKAIPLSNPKPDLDGAQTDAFIEALRAEGEYAL